MNNNMSTTNRPNTDRKRHDSQQQPETAKRPWAKPQIMEENFRNTEDQPEMPFSDPQAS
jgi:hypothetical protein